MKRRYSVLILALAGLVFCQTARAQQTQPAAGGAPAAAAAPAPDPLKDPNCQRRFEATFGREALKVDMSAPKTDDADFAEKLAAAAKADSDTGFQTYLYDKVCIFGLRLPKTYDLVGQALAKLDRLAPMQRRLWEEYRLELFRQLYRQAKAADRTLLGEELIVELILVGDLRVEEGKWDEAAELYRQGVQTALSLKSSQKEVAAERINHVNRMKEVLALRRRLEQNPGDAKLRTSVIYAYMSLADDPGGAADLLNTEVGEAYRTYVPLAARLPCELTSGPLMELGNWYKTLARQATPSAKPTLIRRTREYYVAHISKLRREGATIAAVQEAVKKINASLTQIGQDKLPEKVFFRDPVVRNSFDKAARWLWSVQAHDGGWITDRGGDSFYYGDINTFPTSAALAALFGGGASLDDARAVKAVRWLEPTATAQTDGLAFRCLAWMEVQKRKPGQAGQLLAKDVSALIPATRDGSYGETVTSRGNTMFSRSWQAPLGVDAGQRSGLKAQRAYWQMVGSYWAGQQRADGGMGPHYRGDSKKRPGSPNTIIGAGSLAIALGWLYGPQAVKNPGAAQQCEPLVRALGWLDKNFTTPADLSPEEALDPKKAGDRPERVIFGDATYMLSRLGLATGRDKLGLVRWWTDGGRYLAGLQRPDGSWGNIVDTALAALFMVNGYEFEQANFGELPALLPATDTDTRPATKPATTQDAGQEATAPDAAEAERRLRDRESALKSSLSSHPENRAAAERLIRFYVVELQEPQKALQYADQTGNLMVKRFIGLLGLDVSAIYSGELLGLADWQMALADGAPDAGRRLALARAVNYYRNYLARKPAIPADAAKARDSLEEARDALSDMGGQ